MKSICYSLSTKSFGGSEDFTYSKQSLTKGMKVLRVIRIVSETQNTGYAYMSVETDVLTREIDL